MFAPYMETIRGFGGLCYEVGFFGISCSEGWVEAFCLIMSVRFVKGAVTPFPVRIGPLSCSIPTPESRSLSGFLPTSALGVLLRVRGSSVLVCLSFLPSPLFTLCPGVSLGRFVNWSLSLPLVCPFCFLDVSWFGCSGLSSLETPDIW